MDLQLETNKMSSEANQPLLPTSNQDLNQLQPSVSTLNKFIEITAALRSGKLPTQEQVDKLLQNLSNSDILNSDAIGRTGRFSAEGSLVVEDIRVVIESLQRLGKEKNGSFTLLPLGVIWLTY